MDPEYFLRLDLTVQRWVYFKLNSKMEELKPPVQFPSQDKLQSMAKKEELETFQICGVLYKTDSNLISFLLMVSKPMQYAPK